MKDIDVNVFLCNYAQEPEVTRINIVRYETFKKFTITNFVNGVYVLSFFAKFSIIILLDRKCWTNYT